jgi:hypothetical protein
MPEEDSSSNNEDFERVLRNPMERYTTTRVKLARKRIVRVEEKQKVYLWEPKWEQIFKEAAERSVEEEENEWNWLAKMRPKEEKRKNQ